MATPNIKLVDNIRLGYTKNFMRKLSKKYTEQNSPQKERLRMRNSNATPFPAPVIMSQITKLFVRRPNKKLKPNILNSRMSISLNKNVVMLVDASSTVKFTAELLMSSSSIFSQQNNDKNIAIVICKREVQMPRLLIVSSKSSCT